MSAGLECNRAGAAFPYSGVNLTIIVLQLLPTRTFSRSKPALGAREKQSERVAFSDKRIVFDLNRHTLELHNSDVAPEKAPET